MVRFFGACVAMVESSYKNQCMIDPEGRARELSQAYPGKWTCAGGTAEMMNLSYVLNAEGVKAYGAVHASPGAVYSYLWAYARESTPVIVNIRWANKSGHFAVCPYVDPDGTIIFRDPWYGLYEMQQTSLPSYTPSGASGELSGWIVVTHK